MKVFSEFIRKPTHSFPALGRAQACTTALPDHVTTNARMHDYKAMSVGTFTAQQPISKAGAQHRPRDMQAVRLKR